MGALASVSVISVIPSAMASALHWRPVLLCEWDQCAVRAGPRGAAGVREQHEGEESGDLAVLGQAIAELPGQSDRLGGQLGAMQRKPGAGGVSLVGDQIQHVRHRGHPLRPFGRRGHFEFGATGLDPLFRPADPLTDSRFRDEKRAGDLGGTQPADGAQRQGLGDRGE
jgi:hypothetical protein